MLAIFFLEFNPIYLKDCIKVQEKKSKVVVSCSRPRQNVKLLQAVSRCSRATMAEKCTKKRDARAELLFCQFKPITLLPVSLRLVSSLLKLLNRSKMSGVL